MGARSASHSANTVSTTHSVWLATFAGSDCADSHSRRLGRARGRRRTAPPQMVAVAHQRPQGSAVRAAATLATGARLIVTGMAVCGVAVMEQKMAWHDGYRIRLGPTVETMRRTVDRGDSGERTAVACAA